MTDGLDVVAVRIEDVAAVVVGVLGRSNAGRAVVDPTCLDSCGVEGVHVCAAFSAQCNVKPPPHVLPVGLEEERRSSCTLLAEPAAAPENSMRSVNPSGARALP